MKRIMRTILALTALASCTEPAPEVKSTEVELSGLDETVYVDAVDARDFSFQIESDRNWIITSKGFGEAGVWFTVTPDEGAAGNRKTVTLTAEDNIGVDARSATLTISSAEYSKTITVTQAGSAPFITVDGIADNTVAYTSGGGSTTFTVAGNVPWSIEKGNLDWCEVSPSEGPASEVTTVTLTASVNKGDAREGSFSIRYGEESTAIKVVQEELTNYLVADKTSVSIPGFGGDVSIVINSNVEWTASCSEPWLSCDPISGSGDGMAVTFNADMVESGERSATVTFKGEGVADLLVTVNQKEEVLPPDPTLPRTVVAWNLNRNTVTEEDFVKQNPGWEINPNKGTYNTSGVIMAEDNVNTGSWYCAHRDIPGDYFRTNFSTGLALAGPWIDDGFKFTWKGANATAGRTLAFYCGMRDSTPKVIGYWTVRISLDGEQTWIEPTSIEWYGSGMALGDRYVSPSDVVAKFKLRKQLKNTDVVVFLQATLAPDGRALSRQKTVVQASGAESTTIRFCETVNQFNGGIYNGPSIVLEN